MSEFGKIWDNALNFNKKKARKKKKKKEKILKTYLVVKGGKGRFVTSTSKKSLKKVLSDNTKIMEMVDDEEK